MDFEICDVDKTGMSVGRMSDGRIGTWMAPNDGKRYWLTDENVTPSSSARRAA